MYFVAVFSIVIIYKNRKQERVNYALKRNNILKIIRK